MKCGKEGRSLEQVLREYYYGDKTETVFLLVLPSVSPSHFLPFPFLTKAPPFIFSTMVTHSFNRLASVWSQWDFCASRVDETHCSRLYFTRTIQLSQVVNEWPILTANFLILFWWKESSSGHCLTRQSQKSYEKGHLSGIMFTNKSYVLRWLKDNPPPCELNEDICSISLLVYYHHPEESAKEKALRKCLLSLAND